MSAVELKRYEEIFAALKMKNKNVVKIISARVEFNGGRLVHIQLQLHACFVICVHILSNILRFYHCCVSYTIWSGC